MKQISVYIRAKEISPSGYYRVLQYTNRLDANVHVHNILPPVYYQFYLRYNRNRFLKWVLYLFTYILMYVRVCFFLCKDIRNRADKLIISRGLLPHFFLFPVKYLLEWALKKSDLLWDFDDDILYSGEISKEEFDFLSKRSKNIFVTHDYLAQKVSQDYALKVVVLPTTDGDFKDVYADETLEMRKNTFVNEIRLAWIGSAVNLMHLNAAIPALDATALRLLQKQNKRLILYVCSSVPLKVTTNSLCVENIKWSRTVAVEMVAKSHIGIMPLLPTEYSLGKGGFKLIQYMAAGLPVIGSSVGFNNEIIDDTMGRMVKCISNELEWEKAIEYLSEDWHDYLHFSECAFRKWQDKYSYEVNLHIWKKYLDI